jgi:hypothetical protein
VGGGEGESGADGGNTGESGAVFFEGISEGELENRKWKMESRKGRAKLSYRGRRGKSTEFAEILEEVG